jgi:hypothetical protein
LSTYLTFLNFKVFSDHKNPGLLKLVLLAKNWTKNNFYYKYSPTTNFHPVSDQSYTQAYGDQSQYGGGQQQQNYYGGNMFIPSAPQGN